MKIKIGDYLIETEDRKFIVKAKLDMNWIEDKEIQQHMGKDDKYKNLAHYTSLEEALKHIINNVLLEDDNLLDILAELKVIYMEIKSVSEKFDKVIEIGGIKNE